MEALKLVGAIVYFILLLGLAGYLSWWTVNDFIRFTSYQSLVQWMNRQGVYRIAIHTWRSKQEIVYDTEDISVLEAYKLPLKQLRELNKARNGRSTVYSFIDTAGGYCTFQTV